MSELRDDSDEVLRRGLRALPVPAVSSDFDARVLAALHTRQTWWQRWWQPARPLLAGASFSLVVTLVLLHWTMSMPPAASPAPLLAVGGPSFSRPPSLDALLNRPNLSAGSLAAVWDSPPAPTTPMETPPIDRRPLPRRRAQVFRRACPVA